jgi:hypothetical protein
MKLLTCDDDQQPRSWGPLVRKLAKIYLVLSIPIVAAFVGSSSTRFATAQALARGAAFFFPITRVFCGDQLTRDGGVWGWRISANPLGVLNLAEGNVASWQILEQVRQALKYRPNTIYLTAGRFDIESPGYDESRTIGCLKDILALAHEKGTHVVITLAPYGLSTEKNASLASLNEGIRKELTAATILDLNNMIAPQGTIQSTYATDDGHLNEKAYDVWAGLVKTTMAGGDAFRPVDVQRVPTRR